MSGNPVRKTGRSGQVMTEFMMMLLMFLSVGFTMFFILAAFTEYGWRVTALLGWEPGT